MTDCGPYDFVYVHTDIPEGMTIREWRVHRAAQRVAAETAKRAARRERHRARVRRYVTTVLRPARHVHLRHREVHG